MTAPRVAERYAEALFELARARDAVPHISRDLADLAATVESSPELQRLLERPDLPSERKIAALQSALGDAFSEAIVALLAVLVKHERGDAVHQVAAAYDELAERAAGIVRAEAATVVALTDEQKSRITRVLERITGQHVKLEERVDPAVLAGVRLRIGDSLIDGSAAGRLARLREELLDRRG